MDRSVSALTSNALVVVFLVIDVFQGQTMALILELQLCKYSLYTPFLNPHNERPKGCLQQILGLIISLSDYVLLELN